MNLRVYVFFQVKCFHFLPICSRSRNAGSYGAYIFTFQGTSVLVFIVVIPKTRDLFKKIRDTKGTFHAKMGTIKDRNGMDLTEAENIKKRWQEYTEELYKIDLHDPDNYDGVITHLEPDILECEVKWALASITTNKGSGGDEIPVELFQILKDDAVKVLD